MKSVCTCAIHFLHDGKQEDDSQAMLEGGARRDRERGKERMCECGHI